MRAWLVIAVLLAGCARAEENPCLGSGAASSACLAAAGPSGNDPGATQDPSPQKSEVGSPPTSAPDQTPVIPTRVDASPVPTSSPIDAGVDAAPAQPAPVDAAPPPPPADAGTGTSVCGQSAGAANYGIDPATGHCYIVWTTRLPWVAAEASCEGNNGTLATVTSSSEQARVLDLIAGLDPWIGLNRAQAGDPFTWVTGEPLIATDWATDQPSGASQLCVDFNSVPGGVDGVGWHDRDCASSRPYVCENQP